MGLRAKVKQENTVEQSSQVELTMQEPSLTLSTKETQFIITVLGEADIKVKQIEFVYGLLIKLQDYYVQRTSSDS